MVGLPGAGKTTIASGVFETAGYWRIDGDVYGTVAKMVRRADEGVAAGATSVVFDSTGGTVARRAAFVGWAVRPWQLFATFNWQTCMLLNCMCILPLKVTFCFVGTLKCLILGFPVHLTSSWMIWGRPR